MNIEIDVSIEREMKVHSARSPYVWFCDVITETNHSALLTNIIFE